MRTALYVIEDVVWGMIFVGFVLGGVVWHVATEGFFEIAPATPEDIQKMVTEAVRDSFRLAAFDKAFAEDDIEGVELLKQAAELVGIPVPQAVEARYVEETGIANSAYRHFTQCGNGFVFGEAVGMTGLACSAVSDAMVIGDIRDVVDEMGKIVIGQEPDQLVLGLAAAGLALEVGTLTTGGASLGAKAGASLIKAGVKSATVSRRLMREVGHVLSSAINVAPLKSLSVADATNLPKLRAVASEAVDLRRVEPVIEAAGTLRKIEERGKPIDAIMVMKTAEGLDDIKAAEKVSSVFKGKTGAVLKVIGRKAYDFTGLILKTVVNLTWRMASLIIWAVSGILSGILGLIATIQTVRLVLGVVRRGRKEKEEAFAL